MPGGPALSLEGGERALKTWTLGRAPVISLDTKTGPKTSPVRHAGACPVFLRLDAWPGGSAHRPKERKRKKEKEVNNKCITKFWRLTAARNIIRGVLAALTALAVSGIASAQVKNEEVNFSSISSPVTPTAITPPVGNSAFLVGHGVGTQGYVCLPFGTGASWTVNGARPEATLFTNIFGEAVQIITHFLSPNTNPNKFAPNPLPFANVTWQSSFDSSKVWAQTDKEHTIAAGSDSSCPNTGSIGCLLLQVIGSEEGPTGGKSLTKTTFIQRLNTNGGSAPATGCLIPGDVGKQALVPYTADYFFFRADQ